MTGKLREQGGSSNAFPKKKDSKPADKGSVSQADGTAAESRRGEARETQAHAAQFNKGLADDTSSQSNQSLGENKAPGRETGMEHDKQTDDRLVADKRKTA